MSREKLSTNQENQNNTEWDNLQQEPFAGNQPEAESQEVLELDLNSPEYTAAFGKAEIFAKKGFVNAEQLTKEGLESGAYADKDIRYDKASGNYVVDTYVMRENEDGSRTAELEDTRPVEAGMWVLTNPIQQEGDHPNSYCQKDATFQKRYEATDEPGVYRAKGMARIIKNETGRKVEIDDPWGTKQQGDENCYFCVPYDPDHPFNIPEGKAYILSENDFANYGPAAEVREDFVPIEDYVYAYQIGSHYDDDPDSWYYTCLDPRFPHRHPELTDWYLQGKGKESKDAVMSNKEFLAQYDSMPGDDNEKIYRRKPDAPTPSEPDAQSNAESNTGTYSESYSEWLERYVG